MAKKSKSGLEGKYSKLRKPIILPLPPPTPITLLHTPEQVKQIKNEREKWKQECEIFAAKEIFDKFNLLFDLYGIDRNDPNKWFKLAFGLATYHYAGFSGASPPGRHEKWNDLSLLKLYCDINQIRKEKKNCSIKHACSLLSRREHEYSQSPRTLYNMYFVAKKSIFVEWLKSLSIKHGVDSDENDQYLEEFNAIVNKHHT